MSNSPADLISVAAPLAIHIVDRVLRTALPASAPVLLAGFSSGQTPAELRSALGDIKGLQPVDREMLQRALPMIDAAESGDPIALSEGAAGSARTPPEHRCG